MMAEVNALSSKISDSSEQERASRSITRNSRMLIEGEGLEIPNPLQDNRNQAILSDTAN